MADGPALLCYDGSEPARHAIEVAGALLNGGPALVLTVWEPFMASIVEPIGSTVAVASGLAKDFDDVSVELATKTGEEGAETARRAGFEARPLVLHGNPRDVIVGSAQKHDARVVVMGNRGQGGVESVLYGSVSTGVLHRCSVPVLVVRDSERRPAIS
jgi:nucleotide-binding universal stress UspA family protein